MFDDFDTVPSMCSLTLLFCLCLTISAFSQDSPSLGASAVSAVVSQYIMNTLVRVPETHQPLPSNGKWSISTTRPDSCPHDDIPCARVIYTVPEAHVVCEWTVVPPHGSAPAAFLDQNEDASRYLLRNLPSTDVASLVLASPQPLYPAIARMAHISGSVVVRLVVSGSGTVTSATPIGGHPMLRPAAVDAAKHWTFGALQVGTQPTPFVADLSADFNLESNVPHTQLPNGATMDSHMPGGTVTMHP
jgi:TonB family protein